MDWLTFIIELLRIAAWPATVIALVLLLRRPIRELLRTLLRVRYKELEVEFGEGLKELEEGAEEKALPAPSDDERGELTSTPNELVRLAAISPQAAVLHSWVRVERELGEVARKLRLFESEHVTQSLSVTRPWSLHRIIEEIGKRGLLPDGYAELLHGLRRLRNRLAHGPGETVTEAAALAYGRLAGVIVTALEAIERSPAETSESDSSG